jgi:hypothetical protein
MGAFVPLRERWQRIERAECNLVDIKSASSR